MEHPFHRFTDLFAQLGLPSDSASVSQFIGKNSPLDDAVELENAPFWTDSQANFLREKLEADADWAAVVDQLSAALRAPAHAA
jgi:hypothetical protein